MAKIAFIDVTATVSYGGVQTAVWQLAIALHDLGHQITVVGGEGEVRPELAGRPITILTFPFTPREKVLDLGSRFKRIIERLSLARKARATVAKEAFDWIILTKPFDFFWPWYIGRSAQTRFAFMSGGTDFYWGDRLLGRKINAWFACSHFNAWQIQSRYKRYPRVIYNGVDIDHFSPAQLNLELRQQLGVGEQETLFTFAGRIVGWKGLAVALRALASTLLQNLPLKCLIIGEGPQLMALKNLARALQIENKVIFHPAIPHAALPQYYASSDVGIFPSIGDEAFGITIAEAMSCGKPVIASYIGGIPEVVGNENRSGLLVTPNDVAALAEAMRLLANDALLRQQMGQAARQRITEYYTWQLAAKRLLAGLGQ